MKLRWLAASIALGNLLVPLNSTYDLYSKGKDGASASALNAHASGDDVIRANDGGYIGLASGY